ncbi:MAG: TonB-dependent receptor plug domain-containing protein [Flavobacteriia bacterium]|nr:TonB-dependent receptor plug domain-containing protein [Flavobacteriia bacterium]
MKKCKTFLTGMFLLLCFVSLGQREISGTVLSETKNEPIFGVNVKIKGTIIGTMSDDKGQFIITVRDDKDTLVFSQPEFESIEKPVGLSNNMVVLMKPVTQIETVVVTAMGVKRSEKALGYAVSTVDANTIRNTNQTNVVNSLNGVVAGANITQSSGVAGGSSSIVLRGFTSLTGNNQALFVIDGVKINNNETSLGGEASDNTESVGFSNRGIDINPDDIESISVLKGGAATAIYGIDGANGVIIITTKKGKKNSNGKMTVTAGSSITLSQVNKLPELQNKYAQGIDGTYYPPDSAVSTSWGPSIDMLSYDGATNNPYDKNGNIVLNTDPSAKTAVTPYNNLDAFFKTGYSTKNNFSITGGTEVSNFRLSVSNVKESGVIPTNKFEKTNVSLGTNLSMFDKKFNISGTANYINSGGQRIQQGSNLSGIMLGLLRTPITFDNANGNAKGWESVDAYELADGSQRNYRGEILIQIKENKYLQ